MKDWPSDELKKLQYILKKLIQTGSPIYLWQDTEIIALTLSNLDTFFNSEILKKVTLKPAEDIVSFTVSKLRLPTDQIHVLDDYWVEFLLSEELAVDRPREIKISNCIYDNYQNIFNVLLKSKPPLKAVILDNLVSPNEIAPIISYIQKQIPSLTIKKQYEAISLDQKQIQSFLDTSKISFFNGSLVIEKKEIKDIYKLKLTHPSILAFNTILSMYPRIKYFSLVSSNIPKLNSHLLSDLDTLHLAGHFKGTPQEFYSFFNSIKSLKEIIINFMDFDIINKESEVKPEFLNLFTEIKSFDLNIEKQSIPSDKYIKKLIESACLASPLTKLALSNLIIKSPTFLMDTIPFEQLEELELENIPFIYSQLADILRRGQKIKLLSFSQFRITKEINFAFELAREHDITMPALIELHLLDDADDVLEECDEDYSKTDDIVLLLQDIGTVAPNLRTIHIRTHNYSHYQQAIEILKQTQYSIANKITLESSEENQLTYNDHHTKTPEEDTPQDPVHNLSQHFQYESKDELFTFKGINKTKQQQMIIEKISQYFSLIDRHLDAIPKIQKGICTALSHLFVTMPRESFNTLLNEIQLWDGKSTPSVLLVSLFETLYDSIKKYQFNDPDKNYFLGDKLETFILENKSIFLNSPWHQMGIIALPFSSKKEERSWLVYDPNFVNGPREVNFKQLLELIKRQLGNVLRISLPSDQVAPDIKLEIKNVPEFIREGGILLATQCVNGPEIIDILRKSKQALSKEDYTGLFLRNIYGIPAWAFALQQKTPSFSRYIAKLLTQFTQINNNAEQIIQKSLDSIEPKVKAEIVTLLQEISLPTKADKKSTPKKITDEKKIKPHQQKKKSLTTLTDIIQRTPNTEYYAKKLVTWNSKIMEEVSLFDYTKQVIENDKSKHLIEAKSSKDVAALQNSLQEYCFTNKRPVFYIHSPDDLICFGRWIIRDEKSNTGHIKKGPGGLLRDFLTKNEKNKPILIINYENFSANDLVGFNSILEKNPCTDDGIALPASTKIIGITNINKSDYYQGSDFYSRFNKIERCPVPRDQLDIPPLPFIESDDEKKADTVIHFYRDSSWEEQLLGTWEVKGKVLAFKEGSLISAIKTGGIIDLQNAPWENPKFQEFWRQTFRTGNIEYQNVSFPLPKGIIWRKKNGYSWDHLKHYAFVHSGLLTNGLPTLNPTLFHQFFRQYECDSHHKTLHTVEGWIERHLNYLESKFSLSKQDEENVSFILNQYPLEINVTRELNEDEWFKLLTFCKDKNIKLDLHFSPGIPFPSYLSNKKPEKIKPLSCPWNKTLFVATTDIDMAIAAITDTPTPKTPPVQWETIDISECDSSHLLKHLDGSFDEKSTSFVFIEMEKMLITALKNNKNVILKGRFSQELADHLAAFIMERFSKKSPGKLIIVSEDLSLFPYVSSSFYVSSPEEKIALLKKQGFNTSAFDEKTLNRYSFSQLRAASRAFTIAQEHKNTTYSNGWIGMQDLPVFAKKYPAAGEFTTETFIQKRLNEINTLFKHNAPFIFISGISGIGKTSFIQNEYLNYLQNEKNPGALYQGETNMKAWAEDKRPGQKILFIDEANLSKKQWSEFEGLFNNPTSILIDGQYFSLEKNHRVIFAGNPVNYSDDRKLSPFFLRHGNALLFTPLPPEYIYEKIILPVFSKTGAEAYANELTKIILMMYHFLCEHSADTLLISPREIQMIALLTTSFIEKLAKPTKENALAAAAHYTYEIGNTLIPEGLRELFAKQFKPSHPLIKAEEKELKDAKKNYLITPSRKNVIGLLDDILALRDFRLKQDKKQEEKCYGGLNGVILEGDPGVGKSELVIARLEASGYTDSRYLSPSASALAKSKVYYFIPAKMEYKEKEALIMKAFEEGAIVVIDEINSSPMMERLLNTLLMGKTLSGERPAPGFMIIGTQNPITMSGRRAASVALSRRLLTLALSAYPENELAQILQNKGLSAENSKDLATAFCQQSEKAKKENLSPAPTLRNVVDILEEEILSAIPAKTITALPEIEPSELKFNDPINAIKTILKSFIQEQSALHSSSMWVENPELSAAKKLLGLLHSPNPLITFSPKECEALKKGKLSVLLKDFDLEITNLESSEKPLLSEEFSLS